MPKTTRLTSEEQAKAAVRPMQRMPARGAIAELIEIVGGLEQARLGMVEGAALFGCLIFGYFLACELH